jgi:two-component system NtrC family sensor kinase
MESAGLKVRRASGAQSALEILSRQDVAFDAVISDITMPGDINGIQLALKLRKITPTLPVILVTGYSGKVSEAQDAGFVVLSKPVDLATLLNELKRAFRQAGSSRIRA